MDLDSDHRSHAAIHRFHLHPSVTTGFIFPAYSSYKAIRANDSPTIEHWLMYWVVMACLHLAENTVEWAVNW
jgi:hypothetical protein